MRNGLEWDQITAMATAAYMTEKVMTQLEQVYSTGRTAKNLIPQGLILDLGWNTDQQGPKRQPLPTEKQPEVAATQIMPTQVEGPPSIRL